MSTRKKPTTGADRSRRQPEAMEPLARDDMESKLAAIRVAYGGQAPAPDIDQMLTEIESAQLESDPSFDDPAVERLG